MAEDKSLKWIVISAAVGAAATLVIKDVFPAAAEYFWKNVSKANHLTVRILHKPSDAPIEGATVDLLNKEFTQLLQTQRTSGAGTAVFYNLGNDTYVISITVGSGISRSSSTKPYTYEGGRKIEIIQMDLLTASTRTEAAQQTPPPVTTNVANTSGVLSNLLSIAQGELGQAERVAGQPNPRILEYLAAGGLPEDVSIPWNSAFVNWVVKRAGLPGSNSGTARSWLSWGKSTPESTPGSIAVFWRLSESSPFGSVGFVTRSDANTISFISGNVRDAVNETTLPKSQLLGLRVP